MFNMIEGVNLYLGNDSPNLKGATFLEIENLKLPDLEAPTIAHTPGGGIMGVNYVVAGIAPLVFPFKLRGMNPDRLVAFGYGSFESRHYTGFGMVRDKMSGAKSDVTVVVEGVLNKISSNAFTKNEGVDFDYEVNQVTSYLLRMGTRILFDIDMRTNKFIRDGVDIFADYNRALRIPTA